ncbi:MAG TPA: class I SAM-dependent methyltransferase [Vicinamibacterales bacterium]
MIEGLIKLSRGLLRNRKTSVPFVSSLTYTLRGQTFAEHWTPSNGKPTAARGENRALQGDALNPLKTYFDAHVEGRGIWKFIHYFDIYTRHLAKFVGTDVRVMEIGVYSGGSLGMWREYFGPKCHVYGVDVQEACKAYEDENTTILIGDQADRQFWQTVKSRSPEIDVLIDDGGHLPEQQVVTLEEMLPQLRPGGVFICEDVHGIRNAFTAYTAGLVDHLNEYVSTGRPREFEATGFQQSVYSMHYYPYVVVIEKAERPVSRFACPKHGTVWQPFLGEAKVHLNPETDSR